jgi:DNA polymerase III subunit epsilon
MKLSITRPLAFLDIEATGLTIGFDRIVEISVVKVMPDGSRTSLTQRLNPEMSIPSVVSAIHGIFDADVADKPTFRQFAPELLQFFGNADLAGYNSNKYDIPLLVDEFIRAEVDFDFRSRRLIDVQNIFHKMEQRTLAAAYKFYCEKELINAHSAEADIIATLEVFEAQLERYPELNKDVDFLHKFCSVNNNVDLAGRIVRNDKKQEVFNFGKHKGKPVDEVFTKEPSYYDWMMQGDFPAETKQVITALRLKKLNNSI